MAPRAPFSSPLAEELAEDVLQRFLRYVRVDTQAAYRVAERPSTEKQLDLSRMLVEELREIGLSDAELNEGHSVFATLPGNAEAPVVGLIAHVDTTPDVTGAGVSPIVHGAWEGETIVLPGDPRQTLDPEVLPALAARVGHDIVTSDGTTLLGADDKAGIAEIMAAVAYLARDGDRQRAPIRIAFTVDEEVGRGAEDFDLEAFGADVAYTLDGSDVGELEMETFSAAAMRVTIRGLSVHPGSAKGKLVNAVKLASELVLSVPQGRLSPETTEGREGYVHPHRISGNTEETIVDFIARDHDDDLLASHMELLEKLAQRGRGARAAGEGGHRGAPLLPQHAAVHRGDSRRGRRRARGHPAGWSRAAPCDHPRRDGRRRPLRAGAPDAEPLHGRAGVPLGARVGERAGHGCGSRHHRRARRRLGGIAGARRSLAPPWRASSASTTSPSRSATSTR